MLTGCRTQCARLRHYLTSCSILRPDDQPALRQRLRLQGDPKVIARLLRLERRAGLLRGLGRWCCPRRATRLRDEAHRMKSWNRLRGTDHGSKIRHASNRASGKSHHHPPPLREDRQASRRRDDRGGGAILPGERPHTQTTRRLTIALGLRRIGTRDCAIEPLCLSPPGEVSTLQRQRTKWRAG